MAYIPTPVRRPQDMSVTELCQRFESYVYNDLHQFAHSRSDAGKELQKRGRVVLEAVAAYRATPSKYVSDGTEMAKEVGSAWEWLIATIKKTPDPGDSD